MSIPALHISFVPVEQLRHIESYSQKRAVWLAKKIQAEQMWTKPLCIDRTHSLVMDGQHRMEAAKLLGLSCVPVVLFDYSAVNIWSLRKNYQVDHETVVKRALLGDIYPYKTVKHRFPDEIPDLTIPLQELTLLKLEQVLLCA